MTRTIKRFHILAEESGREVPPIRAEVVFRVISMDKDTLPIVEELAVIVTATDPTWGSDPKLGEEQVTRIEGFIRDGDEVHGVLGSHVIGVTSKDYIGHIEVFFDEA